MTMPRSNVDAADVFYYLLDQGVDQQKAYMIASNLDTSKMDDSTMFSTAFVLGFLPTDMNGQIIPNQYTPEITGSLADAARYASTPEGASWAVGKVAEYWKQGGTSPLAQLVTSQQTRSPESLQREQYQDFMARQGMEAQAADRAAYTYGGEQRGQVSRDIEYNRQLAASDLARKQAWESQIPDMTSPLQVSTPFTEGLRSNISPNAQRYFQQNLGNMFSQEGMAGARANWWEQKYAQPKKLPAGGGEGYEELLDARDEQLARQAAMQDPWQEFLKNYNFEREYKKLTPSERGFYSGKSRPRTRFL